MPAPQNMQHESSKQGGNSKQGSQEGKGNSNAVEVRILPPSGAKSNNKDVAKNNKSDVTVTENKNNKNKSSTGYYGIGVYVMYSHGPFVSEKYGSYSMGNKIWDVVPGYPAEQNGLKKGDIILEADGGRLDNGDDWVTSSSPSEIHLLIYRDGKFLEFRFMRAFIETSRGP
jgi:C-terminal processing protease CtpA/Prc